MKLRKVTKVKKVRVQDDDADLFDLEDAPAKPTPKKKKVEPKEDLADGRYVQIYKSGKWTSIGPFSLKKMWKTFEEKRKAGARVRFYKKNGLTSSISHDTNYWIEPKSEEKGFKVKIAPKKKKGFFNATKFKRVFQHKAVMSVKELHDAEHYVVDISTRDGTTIGIVPGYRLKNKDFYKSKLSVYPRCDDKFRNKRPHATGPKPKLVEVIFPWKTKAGRTLVAYVTPFSSTNMEAREKTDKQYAAAVAKYMTR
jgi:hypothetical protein